VFPFRSEAGRKGGEAHKYTSILGDE